MSNARGSVAEFVSHAKAADPSDFGRIHRRGMADPHRRAMARPALVFVDLDDAVRLAAAGKLSARQKMKSAISGIESARADVLRVAAHISRCL